MDGLIGIGGVAGLLIAAGLALGLAGRRRFDPRWLFAAALLVVLNDALLTRVYGLLPDAFAASQWNWTGKLLALAATLAIAAHPAIGWRAIGLTWRQRAGSLRAALPVALIYVALFVALALAFPSDRADPDTVAFQLTMPGFEEEPFYRGLLLLALDRAFTDRVRMLGVEWGWGALLASALFGLAHALAYSNGAYHFDAATMAATAIPALLAVWLRCRTGSLVLPIALHNFGNAISLIL